MEPEVQLNRPRRKKKNILLIILAAFAGSMLIAAIVFASMTLQNETVYRGITIGSLNASGMSRDELKRALDETYQMVADKQEITLKTERAELRAGFPDLGVTYDSEAAVRNVFAIGRSGTVFDRLYDIANAAVNGIALPMPKAFSQEKVEGFVDEFYSRTLVNVSDGSLFLSDNAATLRSGHHGENIDREKTRELVNELVNSGKGGTIEPEVIITPPTKFNVDDLYRQIASDPVDASYRMENNELKLQPHGFGRKIEKSQLESIVAELEQTENLERNLPVTFIAPKITSEIAASLLFKDELASWNTSFSTGTVNGQNRGHNIGLAVAKIDGMILAPGQEFSYNEVVGPRDIAHGFKMAHVYSAGKIIDGVGGGICQVSSTMYAAILRADLEVVERRNHSFTVGYVPLGQDATAYYGGTDFRFRNSTKWPVKLLASVKKNKIYFTLVGTNDTPGKSVIISSNVLKETPYTVKYMNDPTLPVGTEKEVLPGLTGYVVETYKTVKQDGKVISQAKLHTSTYKAYPQELLRGTKPVAGTAGTGTAAGTTGAAVQAKPGAPGTAAPGSESPAAPAEPTAPSDAAEPAEAIVDETPPPADNTAAESSNDIPDVLAP